MGTAFCGCGEGDGVAEAVFEVLKAGFGGEGEEGGAFFVAADGAVEGVEVGLQGFADEGGEVGGWGAGGGVGGEGVGDVFF